MYRYFNLGLSFLCMIGLASSQSISVKAMTGQRDRTYLRFTLYNDTATWYQALDTCHTKNQLLLNSVENSEERLALEEALYDSLSADYAWTSHFQAKNSNVDIDGNDCTEMYTAQSSTDATCVATEKNFSAAMVTCTEKKRIICVKTKPGMSKYRGYAMKTAPASTLVSAVTTSGEVACVSMCREMSTCFAVNFNSVTSVCSVYEVPAFLLPTTVEYNIEPTEGVVHAAKLTKVRNGGNQNVSWDAIASFPCTATMTTTTKTPSLTSAATPVSAATKTTAATTTATTVSATTTTATTVSATIATTATTAKAATEATATTTAATKTTAATIATATTAAPTKGRETSTGTTITKLSSTPTASITKTSTELPTTNSETKPIISKSTLGTDVISTSPTDVTVHSTSVTLPDTTIQTCVCPCDLLSSQKHLTVEELKEKIAEITEDLRVDTKTTSTYRRTLSSADDKRISSKTIGWSAVVTLIVFFSGIVVLDARNLYTGGKVLFANLKSVLTW